MLDLESGTLLHTIPEVSRKRRTHTIVFGMGAFFALFALGWCLSNQAESGGRDAPL
jgi:hypothetical protein